MKKIFILFVVKFRKPKAVIVNKNKKSGLCSMSNHEEAVNVVENLNGKEIEGEKDLCLRALTNSEKNNKIVHQDVLYSVCQIQNLLEYFDEKDLYSLFSTSSEIFQ